MTLCAGWMLVWLYCKTCPPGVRKLIFYKTTFVRILSDNSIDDFNKRCH